ncbi:hypothetical protein K503DRAFT_134829 [Rhizopogon vinicolor AM-OR11-026]|uniref:Uncharacterized protein n=1 Tax=Rhizopogon vinicolor AM-OR11-026 TaxID=1314800 RepID=A0A1B7N1Q7_9AGAM|nr:hypothetical protein K503DRAFT_134829 [Rhizopogon vinicolor AM-OR11-026]
MPAISAPPSPCTTTLLANCIIILTRLHGILIGLSQQKQGRPHSSTLGPSHYQTYCIQSDPCIYPPRLSGTRYALSFDSPHIAPVIKAISSSLGWRV